MKWKEINKKEEMRASQPSHKLSAIEQRVQTGKTTAVNWSLLVLLIEWWVRSVRMSTEPCLSLSLPPVGTLKKDAT